MPDSPTSAQFLETITYVASVAAVLGGLITAAGVQLVSWAKQRAAEKEVDHKLSADERNQEYTRINHGYEVLVTKLEAEKNDRIKEYQQVLAELRKMTQDHMDCRLDYAKLTEKYNALSEKYSAVLVRMEQMEKQIIELEAKLDDADRSA